MRRAALLLRDPTDAEKKQLAAGVSPERALAQFRACYAREPAPREQQDFRLDLQGLWVIVMRDEKGDDSR
jgi:hypothetical protein